MKKEKEFVTVEEFLRSGLLEEQDISKHALEQLSNAGILTLYDLTKTQSAELRAKNVDLQSMFEAIVVLSRVKAFIEEYAESK